MDMVMYRAGFDVPIVAATTFGSLLPDIDHPESKLGRKIPLIPHILYLFGRRGITHSLLFILILTAAGHFVWLPAYGLALGAAVHIAADMLTPAGVPFFWPHKRRYSLLGFRTGGIVDHLIGTLAIVLAVVFILISVFRNRLNLDSLPFIIVIQLG